MIRLEPKELAQYLRSRFGDDATLVSAGAIGETADRTTVKSYGYGTPIAVVFEQAGRRRTVVLETVKPGPFGHEHRADRAQAILWDYDSYDALPSHVRALDVGAFTSAGSMRSLHDARELFLVTEYVSGRGYQEDLERLARTGRMRALDLQRAEALADYLAEIHARKKRSADLYRRRMRELIGHGECIMGLTDSYPAHFSFIDERLLRHIEDAANQWRWKLHNQGARLSAVHGDFHPWNILFRDGVDFSVLDRSRGEWGEPADDVTALAVNYVFFSLRRYGKLAGPFTELFSTFWHRYEQSSHDHALREVVAPFFAFRGLVIASPLWYPDLTVATRRSIFRFMENVLAEPVFDPDAVNHYLGD